MDDHPLLCCRIAELSARLEAAPDQADAIWSAVAGSHARSTQPDPEVADALAARDLTRVAKILDDWDHDRRPRPLEDRELLKKAMKAYRKRLKVTRLDDESRLGVGATTKGGSSGIFGITPPTDFPAEVWKELARQGRLKVVGTRGLYALNE